ncbi:helix-turn-helix domain-containing protein [Pseudomonas chengduensis]|jgi:excisionase family DNA binding protein|nr:helix-turn-helix domain-containing protein [Pseudomonas chengduensis]MAE20839.1 DNA-binding protein [Pseudomonas sp.]MDH1282621.1 helix-turn-helix domain-containing protein [Pseudomonas chengduensis]|tara:strand:+ start:860 stop:1063 length:204 start_codon:yes stop_codon:yes gene_type:complete
MTQQHQATAPIAVGVEDAARLIGITRSKLYEMLAEGKIRSFKLGRRRLIQVQELEFFIQRHANENGR